MGETNYPSVAHVGYGISPLSRVKLEILTTLLTASDYNFYFNSLEWRNIIPHGQLKENLYISLISNFPDFTAVCDVAVAIPLYSLH